MSIEARSLGPRGVVRYDVWLMSRLADQSDLAAPDASKQDRPADQAVTPPPHDAPEPTAAPVSPGLPPLDESKLTPAMKQFVHFKKQHPGCVLFFRMGDFYEMFYDDAVLAHKTLGITLTQRTAGVPMAGVPFHAAEGYLRRMIQAGHRVAVCDQVEDPAQAKGVVQRDVTRVITPGTLTDESLLEEGASAPLASIVFHGDATASIAWAELSTGHLSVASVDEASAADELSRIGPGELLYCQTADGVEPPHIVELSRKLGCPAVGRPAWQFRLNEAGEALRRQYGVASLAGFGFEGDEPMLMAAGGVLAYLLETQRADAAGRLAHLRPPKRYERSAHMVIDQATLRSLEVERTARSGEVSGSLLATIQDCVTAAGKRMLRQWLCYPLCDRQAIEARQRVVAAMVDDTRLLQELRTTFDGIQDIERIVARLAVGRATPRDLVALGRSAGYAQAVASLLEQRPTLSDYQAQAAELVQALGELALRLADACVDSPPTHLREGGLIRDGFDAPLDEARSLQNDSHAWLAEYQAELAEQIGVASLKVGYNKVFGYYIELSAAQRDKAPDAWTRKQTLKNAERFITPQLKEFEGKVLSAESRAVAREQKLFDQLCDQACKQTDALHRFAQLAATLDVLSCFAKRAVRYRYARPRIVDQPVLDIRGGRHPVLDEWLDDRFVPNDAWLGVAMPSNAEDEQAAQEDLQEHEPISLVPGPTLALITGPNMAGKSTYIRQAALLTLLAHTGSFVPADRATVGLCDRIFTRIGASDELHAGQSTFMVEMTETANLCHHATARSLVVLDEIGRGTSTLDGLSLAWAIAEHLAKLGCRTLFATHYHELTSLAEQLDSVTNLSVTVREWQDQIVFLHRIRPGSTDRSYGIHVAKIAGLPPGVIKRANDLLARLAVNHDASAIGPELAPKNNTAPDAHPSVQLPSMPLFAQAAEDPTVRALKELQLDAMTPLNAFDWLRQHQAQLLERDADNP